METPGLLAATADRQRSQTQFDHPQQSVPHLGAHEGDRLVVSNPKVPKLEPEPSTGIGLENLRNRWHLITGRSIEIDDDGRTFTVRMPLQNPTAG